MCLLQLMSLIYLPRGHWKWALAGATLWPLLPGTNMRQSLYIGLPLRVTTCYLFCPVLRQKQFLLTQSGGGSWEFCSPSLVLIIMHLSTVSQCLNQTTNSQFYDKHGVIAFFHTEILLFIVIIRKALMVFIRCSIIMGSQNWVYVLIFTSIHVHCRNRYISRLTWWRLDDQIFIYGRLRIFFSYPFYLDYF